MKKVTLSIILSSLLLLGCSENISINSYDNNNVSILSKKSRDIFSVIEKNNEEYKKRNPELIKIKYDAMSESAFSFYRATAYIFYMDIFKTSLNQGININIQGDLHLDNIGTYFASNGKVYYDLNDFDDAFTGSYALDLSRVLTSIYLASDEFKYSNKDADEFSDHFLEAYEDYMKYFLNNKTEINQPFINLSKAAKKSVDKTISNSYQDFLSEISLNNKFIYSDKIRKVSPEIFNDVSQALKKYSTSTKNPSLLKVKDIGFYVAGKGSLGRYRYIILLEGNTSKSNDDIVLEIKEATSSSSDYANKKITRNNASRVVNSTKYFLTYPDIYLGITNIKDIEFYVRRVMPDEKVNLKKLDNKSEFKDHLKTVAAIVAKSHSKSGKSQLITNDFPDKKALIKSYSKDYFNQVLSDFQSFKKSL